MFGIETGAASTLYRVVLAAHILLSIGGFGAVMLNGVYAAHAKQRPGPEGRAISEANYAVSNIAEVLILAVPVSGLALVWASDGAWSLSDGLDLGEPRPVRRRLRHLAERAHARTPSNQPAPGRTRQRAGCRPRRARLAEVDRIGKAMAVSGAGLNLLLVAIVALMIWKPMG